MIKQRLHRKICQASGIALLLAMTQLASQVHGAQTQTPQQPLPAVPAARSGSEPALPTFVGDYRIGVGDVIEVRVDKAQELSGTYRVTSNGTFEMYYLGRVVALNKTPEELSTLIADGLRGRYLTAPRVAVDVKQQNSQRVFVQGAVRNPGVYQLEGKVSLLKLISLCGGLAENHGSSAFIFREGGATREGSATTEMPSEPVAAGSIPAERRTQTGGDSAELPDYVFNAVNISGLLKGHLNENVMIEPHDIVNIPVADVFFVAGEVRAPGSFQLKAGTTLRQAISLAQGMTMQAAKSRAIIFREDSSTGKRIDMKIDVGAVMEGKSEDLAIMANDVIIVPNSKLKSVGAALLRSFGLSASQGILRN